MSKAVITGDKRVGGWIARNAATVLMLPPPQHEWAWYDLPERVDTPDPFPEAFLQKRSTLKTYGVIKQVGSEKRERPNGSSGYRSLWSVPRTVWKFAAQEFKKKQQSNETLPCGHRSGFTTLDADAGQYECGYEFCDRVYDRATIKAVEF